MSDPPEDEFDPTGSSTESESTDMGPADASVDFLAQKLNPKKRKLLQEGDIEAPDADDQYQDTRMKICKYCGRDFQSDQALGGHLRVHSQHEPKSRAGNIHPVKNKRPRKQKHPSKEDDGFVCFICPESFPTMQLLCQHVRNKHRENGSKPNGGSQQQPTPSQRIRSLSEPDDQTTLEEEEQADEVVSPGDNQNQDSLKDLLNHILNWSATGKRGHKRTSTDKIDVDNIIYDAVPLRAYYGFMDPGNQTERRHEDSQDSNHSNLLTTKQQNTEETMSNQDYCALSESESEAADCLASFSSQIWGYQNSKQTTKRKMSRMPQGFGSHPNYKTKFTSGQERLKETKHSNKAMKSVHQCEICGKMFETGQALGGHKSYHRFDPFRGMSIQRKAKEQSSGETEQVSDGFSIILLPGELSDKADHSDESSEENPKRLLDFDLNIPYVE